MPAMDAIKHGSGPEVIAQQAVLLVWQLQKHSEEEQKHSAHGQLSDWKQFIQWLAIVVALLVHFFTKIK